MMVFENGADHILGPLGPQVVKIRVGTISPKQLEHNRDLADVIIGARYIVTITVCRAGK